MKGKIMTLTDVICEAQVKGLRDQELVDLERVWVDTVTRFEMVKPRPDYATSSSAMAYLEEKNWVAYAAAKQYMIKVIDSWHKEVKL